MTSPFFSRARVASKLGHLRTLIKVFKNGAKFLSIFIFLGINCNSSLLMQDWVENTGIGGIIS